MIHYGVLHQNDSLQYKVVPLGAEEEEEDDDDEEDMEDGLIQLNEPGKRRNKNSKWRKLKNKMVDQIFKQPFLKYKILFRIGVYYLIYLCILNCLN